MYSYIGMSIEYTRLSNSEQCLQAEFERSPGVQDWPNN